MSRLLLTNSLLVTNVAKVSLLNNHKGIWPYSNKAEGNSARNLNDSLYETDDGYKPFVDGWSVATQCEFVNTKARVVFRQIEETLTELIEKSDYVVGCVAWLTNTPILEALSQCSGCQFVVQTEDWLRPDSGDYTLARQRDLIRALPALENYSLPRVPSVCSLFELDPIRLSGIPRNDSRNQPRMHHKFAIFGNRKPHTEESGCWDIEYHTVFTGSFNWTRNATMSLENGLILKGREIVDAYCREYFQILLTSRKIEQEWWDAPTYGWNSGDEHMRDGT